MIISLLQKRFYSISKRFVLKPVGLKGLSGWHGYTRDIAGGRVGIPLRLRRGERGTEQDRDRWNRYGTVRCGREATVGKNAFRAGCWGTV